jgi:hypothetical protein
MSNSYTYSNTNTYTVARARYVLGKIKDDFMNVAYRGFTTISYSTLMSWWEDVSFVVNEQALEKCELQFKWDGKTAAVIYEMVTDGSIHIDTDSAAINFYRIPAYATVGIVIRRDRNNEVVSNYLQKRGWTSNGSFLAGTAVPAGGYSQGGFGPNVKTIGI